MGGQTSFTLSSTFAVTYNALAPQVRIRIRVEDDVQQIDDKDQVYFIERHLIPREGVENG